MQQSKDTDWQIDKKPKPINVLYPGNSSHIQGYTKVQNKGMEEDLQSKCRPKKKQELQFSSLIKWTLKQQRSKETKKAII